MGVKIARDRARDAAPRDHRARDGGALLGASGVLEGRPLLRSEARPGAAAARPPARRRRLQAPDHARTPCCWSARAPSFTLGRSTPSRSSRRSRSSGTSTSTSTRASAATSCRSPRSWATRSRRFDFRVPGVTTISRRPAQVRLHGQGRLDDPSAATRTSSGTRCSRSARRSGRRTGTSRRPMTGTRPGGAIAAAWAVLKYLGEDGYLRLVGQAMRYMERF